MVPALFSSTLPKFEGDIKNSRLLATLQELSGLLGGDLTILSWSEKQVALPLIISVSLPPLGNKDGLDIRSEEPVIIVFSLDNYPSIAPRVCTDRLDFPKEELAHLYVAKGGKPPGFCLVRGSMEEWYANKRIADLLIRIENWLRDAATGELTNDGDQFDPLRLEDYSGTVVYDYDTLAYIVVNNKSIRDGGNMTVGLFEMYLLEDSLSYKLIRIVTAENLKESLTEISKEEKKDIELKRRLVFGAIIWARNQDTFDKYFVDMPSNWEEFNQFCKHHAISLDDCENLLADPTINNYKWIPVICAIRRPKPVIGFNGNIEFINFAVQVDVGDSKDAKIINNVSVIFQKHNQPLTAKKAAEISGFAKHFHNAPLIVGCGALGSKIALHLARSGVTNLILADGDDMSPHNLVRHALLANSEGINKAAALKAEIQRIYPYEKTAVLATPCQGEIWLTKELASTIQCLLDLTASNSFLNELILAELKSDNYVAKGYISDFGNIGLLLIEGEDRNPRLDDMQVFLYAQSRSLSFISDWLIREKNQDQTKLLTVGVGCNSETIVLSDDIVSLHAAIFSSIVKVDRDQSRGKIFLNEVLKVPFFHNVPREIIVPQVTIFHAENDPEWQIRFFPGILEIMKEEMHNALPNETGGVFLGAANFKTKTVHVVELIRRPSDSQSDEVCFCRGVKDLPEAVKEINDASGNQLGYIGEWHSHPNGPNSMSTVDLATVQRFKKEFSQLPAPLPVFLTIITPDRIIPYVF